MVLNDVTGEMLLINTNPALTGAPVPSNTDTVAGARARKPSTW